VCTYLKQKGVAIDWIVNESIDGTAFQTLNIELLHEKWKVAPYGVCIRILSFQKWPAKDPSCGTPLAPTPEMIRQQSLSYWGVSPTIPPSEHIVSNALPPNAKELVDRIKVNRERREEHVRERKEKKKLKDEQTLKILDRKRAGRGESYLVSFNADLPKWIPRSQIPKRFSKEVEKFDAESKFSDKNASDEDSDDIFKAPGLFN